MKTFMPLWVFNQVSPLGVFTTINDPIRFPLPVDVACVSHLLGFLLPAAGAAPLLLVWATGTAPTQPRGFSGLADLERRTGLHPCSWGRIKVWISSLSP